MGKIANPHYLLLLAGGAAAVGSILILAVFLLQKSLGRNTKRERPKSMPLSPDEEATFTLTSVKSVVTQLKAEQQTMQEQLRAAERRAETSARQVEIISRQIPHGVIVFDAQGYIAFSNAQVRTMLAIDTWSRRRYAEIFKNIPNLLDLITPCFEGSQEVRGKLVDLQLETGSTRRVEASILPTRNNTGGLESVVCIFATPASGTLLT
jgi:PAS domain-containing protein